ncbi:MAG: hypothetical protein OXH57_06795, partial [Ekhidna sp.]|nr:hypothetical protein [Ekhidna sp.]
GTIKNCYAGGQDYSKLLGGGSGTITASYYQAATVSSADDADKTVQAKTASVLQSPTGYSGIYEDWNIDLNGNGSNDDPWDFGSASQYPVLKIDFDGDGDTSDDVTRQRN